MSGDLHQQLAQAAEREQVSLNRFVTDALAESVTGGGAHEPAAPTDPPADVAPVDDAPAERARNPRRTLRMVLAANLVVVVLAGTIAVVLLVLALQQKL
jgi:hypothetical protein